MIFLHLLFCTNLLNYPMSCADSNFSLPLIFIEFAFGRLRGLRVSGSFVCAARSARAPNSKDRLLPRQ